MSENILQRIIDRAESIKQDTVKYQRDFFVADQASMDEQDKLTKKLIAHLIVLEQEVKKLYTNFIKKI